MLPKVMLICIDCPEGRIREKAGELNYENLEIKSIFLETEGIKKVLLTILNTECAYVCFGESRWTSDPAKIGRMVEYLEKNKNYDAVFCLSRYMDEEGEIACHIPNVIYDFLEKESLDAFQFFGFSLYWEVNILGSLENCMIRREAYLRKAFLLGDGLRIKKTEEKMALLWESIYGMKMGIIPEALVSGRESPLDAVRLYADYLWYQDLRNKVMNYIGQVGYPVKELPSVHRRMAEKDFDKRTMVPKVQRRITVFYTSIAEYNNLQPIGEEAVRRGYQVEFTEEIEKSAEIGIYCSHVGIIKNRGNQARLSVILLHDLLQGELNWPNLWSDEPWDSFDIGILPGKDWSERWRRCSGFYGAHPKLGVYELGYPKGDRIISREFQQYVKEFRGNMGLKYQYSILYAPSWENDGKEDDFIKAIQKFNVNLLIKQAACNEWYSDIVRNIQEMRKLHEGKYDNVYYIEPEEDIFTALAICDLVVSDESSVMAEALLFGKPSIAVMDWIIPEKEPRYPKVPVDYVYKCKKAQLGECVEGLIGRINAGEKVDRADEVFSNVGKSASDIMDLIEYCTGEKEECSCLNKELNPIYMLHGLWNA